MEIQSEDAGDKPVVKNRMLSKSFDLSWKKKIRL
jgi:hypothetical protein